MKKIFYSFISLWRIYLSAISDGLINRFQFWQPGAVDVIVDYFWRFSKEELSWTKNVYSVKW